MGKIISKNPATGETLREIDATSPDQLPAIFKKAHEAQAKWGAMRPKKRAFYLIELREALLDRVDEIAALISQENGKPKFEALSNEIFPSVLMITHFAKRGPDLLRNKPIKLWSMPHRTSHLNYWPLGVVGIISPWNYPFMLPFGDIVMALIAGNAVILKPSEETTLVGLKIQELCDLAGFMPGLVQTIVGDGSLGAALIAEKPAKIFFTGSTATGKKVMAAAAEHPIPVNLELGGKNPMIVLADANLDFATSAALWGSFSNSGQLCAQVSRIMLHESIAEPFLIKFKEKIGKLRQGPASPGQQVDMGVATLEKQKLVYQAHIDDAKKRGLSFLTGGDLSSDRKFLKPTVISGAGTEDSLVYLDETFGPAVTVTTFKSIAEAIQKANSNRFGLAASVITKNQALGEEIARQLEVGTVMINEVVSTAGFPETPWGGVKESGFGRTHSDDGLMEFVNVRHIHRPRSRLLISKQIWWFPYTEFQYTTLYMFLGLFRKHWFDKIRAFPLVLWNLVQLLKTERRL